jgi:hypothetical protein
MRQKDFLYCSAGTRGVSDPHNFNTAPAPDRKRCCSAPLAYALKAQILKVIKFDEAPDPVSQIMRLLTAPALQHRLYLNAFSLGTSEKSHC